MPASLHALPAKIRSFCDITKSSKKKIGITFGYVAKTSYPFATREVSLT